MPNRKISAVIITFNEADKIERCINSIYNVVDEIIVVDSNSNDNTIEICKKFDNVKVFVRDWEGYSNAKNFGNMQASNDWILSIDADEAFSSELAESLAWEKNNTDKEFLKINRLPNYCGQWIKHCGWYPDVHLRLFNRRIAEWKGSVHEKLVFNSPVASIPVLQGDCFHYTTSNIEDHINKVNKYSSLYAQSKVEKGKKGSVLKLIVVPLWKFIQIYFFKLGFLDGFNGFIISMMGGYSKFLRYSKIIQLNKKLNQK